MVNTASTDGAPTILERRPSRIDSAVTLFAADAVVATIARRINIYDFRFFIIDKRKTLLQCLFEQALHLVGSHQHIARLGTLCRPYDSHLLHLIHETAGLVEADLKLTLQARDRCLGL